MKRENLSRAKALRQRMSLPEVLLWQRLRPSINSACRIRRQHLFEDRYVLDFYCPKANLCIEIDGKWSHMDTYARDEQRDQFLLQRGVRTYRIAAASVLANPDSVADFIIQLCTGDLEIPER
ncbi:MAG TPA: DUF559 domain-containing protein [Fimbriimonas sp.]|nr:DUF559 domain-containing protein [Fimbriimonas sp.]